MQAEIYPAADGWRFRVKGSNDELLCASQAYMRREDAESALKQIFGFGQPLEVTVRHHSSEVEDHYTIGGPRVVDGLDEIYTGPMEDTTAAFRQVCRTVEPDDES